MPKHSASKPRHDWREVSEDMIRALDEQIPGQAAAAALKDAAEIKARGGLYRFWLTPQGEVCVQEGVIVAGGGHG